MSNLQVTLKSLASEFAAGILAALRTASLDELQGASTNGKATTAPKRNGSPSRTVTPSNVRMDILGSVVKLLATAPEGLRAEQIRETLGIDKPTVTKALGEGLSSKTLKKTGEKRATRYFNR